MIRTEIIRQYGHHTMTLVPYMAHLANGSIDIDNCTCQITFRDVMDGIIWSKGFYLKAGWACMDMFEAVGAFDVA